MHAALDLQQRQILQNLKILRINFQCILVAFDGVIEFLLRAVEQTIHVPVGVYLVSTNVDSKEESEKSRPIRYQAFVVFGFFVFVFLVPAHVRFEIHHHPLFDQTGSFFLFGAEAVQC